MANGGQWIDVLGKRFYVAHDKATCPTSGIPNAFGWKVGLTASCSDSATTLCNSYCYVRLHERAFAATDQALKTNWATVREIEREHGEAGLVELFTNVFNVTVAAIEKYEKRTGTTIQHVFRLTWAGEIYSDVLASALVRAMDAVPFLHYWAYTKVGAARIERLLPAIKSTRLRLLLSADDENAAAVAEKQAYFEREHGVLLTIFRARPAEHVTSGNTCPKIDPRFKHNFPLAKKAGDVGPCVKCTKCVVERKPTRMITVPIH